MQTNMSFGHVELKYREKVTDACSFSGWARKGKSY
jgi:hypothetical protein